MTQERQAKRSRGRPPTKIMPERINASAEEIASTVLSMPNKKDWRYLRGAQSPKNGETVT